MIAYAEDLLAELDEAGIKIWVEGSQLKISSPDVALSSELLAKIKTRKQDLIDLLSTPRSTGPIKTTLDLEDPMFVSCPYKTYETLRNDGGIYKSQKGSWILSSYNDVRDALINPLLGNAPAPYSWVHKKNKDKSVVAEIANNIIPFMDGDEHVTCRKLLALAFFSHLKNAELDLDNLIGQLIEPFLADGKVDLVNDIGRPFASIAIARLLGLPENDHVRLGNWGDLFLYVLTGVPSEELRNQVEIELLDFRNYSSYHVSQRTEIAQNDLISAMLQVRDGNQSLTQDQVIDTVMLLVGDGIENVASAIGSCMATLLLHTDTLNLINDEPAKLKRAITECLRYESPQQYIARIALEDLMICGQQIRKNESVLLMLASANHDPEAYSAPENFNVNRAENWLLSFGRGRHSCLGAQLVPVLLEAALKGLLNKLHDIKLEQRSLKWRTRPGHRWLEAYPIQFRTASATPKKV